MCRLVNETIPSLLACYLVTTGKQLGKGMNQDHNARCDLLEDIPSYVSNCVGDKTTKAGHSGGNVFSTTGANSVLSH